jgi:hypothetical protein
MVDPTIWTEVLRDGDVLTESLGYDRNRRCKAIRKPPAEWRKAHSNGPREQARRQFPVKVLALVALR